jgi:hypothetical protein
MGRSLWEELRPSASCVFSVRGEGFLGGAKPWLRVWGKNGVLTVAAPKTRFIKILGLAVLEGDVASDVHVLLYSVRLRLHVM